MIIIIITSTTKSVALALKRCVTKGVGHYLSNKQLFCLKQTRQEKHENKLTANISTRNVSRRSLCRASRRRPDETRPTQDRDVFSVSSRYIIVAIIYPMYLAFSCIDRQYISRQFRSPVYSRQCILLVFLDSVDRRVYTIYINKIATSRVAKRKARYGAT